MLIFSKYYEFIAGEDRYRTLKNLNPDSYKELLEGNLENAKDRYEYLVNLVKKKDDN